MPRAKKVSHKKSTKGKVSAKKILSQYEQGLSSNLIAQRHGINVAQVSNVLRSNGIKPRAYRATPDYMNSVLHVLILAGFSYADISAKAHIAHSYIREYVSRTEEIKQQSEELFRRKSNQKVPPTVPPQSVCSAEMIEEFRKAYEGGLLGFSLLVTNLKATDEQIVYLFSAIDEEMIEQHNINLKKVILSEIKAGIPAMGIGKKVGVSPSYVASVAKK